MGLSVACLNYRGAAASVQRSRTSLECRLVNGIPAGGLAVQLGTPTRLRWQDRSQCEERRKPDEFRREGIRARQR
jgi:hypothetical protein